MNAISKLFSKVAIRFNRIELNKLTRKHFADMNLVNSDLVNSINENVRNQSLANGLGETIVVLTRQLEAQTKQTEDWKRMHNKLREEGGHVIIVSLSCCGLLIISHQMNCILGCRS